MLHLTALPLLLLAPASASNWFPLEEGNTWVYRASPVPDALTLTVGAQVIVAGDTYYPLSGYTGRTLLVRTHVDGSLYYRDEQAGKDVLLTSFSPSQMPLPAPERMCPEEQQAQTGTEPYDGPAGRLGVPLIVSYRVLLCADAGVTEEHFVENLGMVRRVITTIAGPRAYDLVYARVSGITIAERPNSSFRVTLQRLEANRIVVGLRLSTSPSESLALSFRTSQEYDVAIRNERGETLYLWSQGKAFLQALHGRVVRGDLEYTVELPLAQPLQQGTYTIEGWLTSGASQHEFSAVLGFEAASSTRTAQRGCPGGRPCTPVPSRPGRRR